MVLTIVDNTQELKGNEFRLKNELLEAYSDKVSLSTTNLAPLFKAKINTASVCKSLTEKEQQLASILDKYSSKDDLLNQLAIILQETFGLVSTDEQTHLNKSKVNDLILFDIKRFYFWYKQEGLTYKNKNHFNLLINSYLYINRQSSDLEQLMLETYQNISVKQVKTESIIKKIMKLSKETLEKVFTPNELVIMSDFCESEKLKQALFSIREIYSTLDNNFSVSKKLTRFIDFFDKNYYRNMVSVTFTILETGNFKLNDNIAKNIHSYFETRNYETVALVKSQNQVTIRVLEKQDHAFLYDKLGTISLELFQRNTYKNSSFLISSEVLDLQTNQTLENLSLYDK